MLLLLILYSGVGWNDQNVSPEQNKLSNSFSGVGCARTPGETVEHGRMLQAENNAPMTLQHTPLQPTDYSKRMEKQRRFQPQEPLRAGNDRRDKTPMGFGNFSELGFGAVEPINVAGGARGGQSGGGGVMFGAQSPPLDNVGSHPFNRGTDDGRHGPVEARGGGGMQGVMRAPAGGYYGDVRCEGIGAGNVFNSRSGYFTKGREEGGHGQYGMGTYQPSLRNAWEKDGRRDGDYLKESRTEPLPVKPESMRE